MLLLVVTKILIVLGLIIPVEYSIIKPKFP